MQVNSSCCFGHLKKDSSLWGAVHRYGNILLSERNPPFSRLSSWPTETQNVWYGQVFRQQSMNVYWLRTQHMVDDDTMTMRKRMSDAQRISSSSSPPIILTHKEDLSLPIELASLHEPSQ